MASRGRKPLPPAVKAARGTSQPCRDGVDTIESLSPALSIKPPELPLDVADVWAEYVELAVQHGARQCDAESFAEWCSMATCLRKCRKSEEPAPASYVAQFRMLGELFGLAGPKSRVMPKGSAPEKPANPFARNGSR